MPLLPCGQVEEFSAPWTEKPQQAGRCVKMCLSPCEGLVACLCENRLFVVDALAPGKCVAAAAPFGADGQELGPAADLQWLLADNQKLFLFVLHQGSCRVSVYSLDTIAHAQSAPKSSLYEGRPTDPDHYRRLQQRRQRSESSKQTRRKTSSVSGSFNCCSRGYLFRLVLSALVTVRVGVWGRPLGFASVLERPRAVHTYWAAKLAQQHRCAVVWTSRGYLLALDTGGKAIGKFRLVNLPAVVEQAEQHPGDMKNENTQQKLWHCECLCTFRRDTASGKPVGLKIVALVSWIPCFQQLRLCEGEFPLAGSDNEGTTASAPPWIPLKTALLDVHVSPGTVFSLNFDRGVLAVSFSSRDLAVQNKAELEAPLKSHAKVALFHFDALVRATLKPWATECEIGQFRRDDDGPRNDSKTQAQSPALRYAELDPIPLFPCGEGSVEDSASLGAVSQGSSGQFAAQSAVAMQWSSDGTALAVRFSGGGFVVWHILGAVVVNMLSPATSRPRMFDILRESLCWGPSGGSLLVWSQPYDEYCPAGASDDTKLLPTTRKRRPRLARVSFLRCESSVVQQKGYRRGALPVLLGQAHIRILSPTVDQPTEFEWQRVECLSTSILQSFFDKSIVHGAVDAPCTSAECGNRSRVQNIRPGCSRMPFVLRSVAATATGAVLALVLRSGHVQVILPLVKGSDGHTLGTSANSCSSRNHGQWGIGRRNASVGHPRNVGSAFKWTPAVVRAWNSAHGRKLHATHVAWTVLPVESPQQQMALSSAKTCALVLTVLHCRRSKAGRPSFWLSVFAVQQGDGLVATIDEESSNDQVHPDDVVFAGATFPSDRGHLNRRANTNLHLDRATIDLASTGEPVSLCVEDGTVVVSFSTLGFEMFKVKLFAPNLNSGDDDEFASLRLVRMGRPEALMVECQRGRVPADANHATHIPIAPLCNLLPETLKLFLAPVICRVSPGAKFLFFRSFGAAAQQYLWWRHRDDDGLAPWVQVKLLKCGVASWFNEEVWTLPQSSPLGRISGCLALLKSSVNGHQSTGNKPGIAVPGVSQRAQQRVHFHWPQLLSVPSVHLQESSPSQAAIQEASSIAWSSNWHSVGFLAGVVALVGVRAVRQHRPDERPRGFQARFPHESQTPDPAARLRPLPRWKLRATLQPCFHALLAALIAGGHVQVAQAMVQRAFRTGAPALGYALEMLLYHAVDVRLRSTRNHVSHTADGNHGSPPTTADDATNSDKFLRAALRVIRSAHLTMENKTCDSANHEPHADNLSYLFIHTLVTCARKIDPAVHWPILFKPCFENPTPMHIFHWCLRRGHFEQAVLCANLLLHCVCNPTFLTLSQTPDDENGGVLKPTRLSTSGKTASNKAFNDQRRKKRPAVPPFGHNFAYSMQNYYADLLLLYRTCLERGFPFGRAKGSRAAGNSRGVPASFGCASQSSSLLVCLPYAARHLAASNLFGEVAGTPSASAASTEALCALCVSTSAHVNECLRHLINIGTALQRLKRATSLASTCTHYHTNIDASLSTLLRQLSTAAGGLSGSEKLFESTARLAGRPPPSDPGKHIPSESAQAAAKIEIHRSVRPGALVAIFEAACQLVIRFSTEEERNKSRQTNDELANASLGLEQALQCLFNLGFPVLAIVLALATDKQDSVRKWISATDARGCIVYLCKDPDGPPHHAREGSVHHGYAYQRIRPREVLHMLSDALKELVQESQNVQADSQSELPPTHALSPELFIVVQRVVDSLDGFMFQSF
eukprot:INCI14981.1.p1 GENE.INCI14981.1~~INCI14981.1.p1  ORF type:complete len:1742 (-),score=231.81 INCI14981.1:1321-6546(-)